VALLVFQQRGVLIDGEGLAGDSEVASDHGVGWGLIDWMLDS
jgi:hypothetical protein